MTPHTLNRLKDWFIEHTQAYEKNDPHEDNAYRLKIDHTLRVCDNIRRVGGSIGLIKGDNCLAQAIGLFHDIGRFKQFARYRTFSDAQSANHARLSLQVLGRETIWHTLPLYERRLAAGAIAYHNAALLPDSAGPRALRFMRLIRDADKIDIWKVVTEYYHRIEKTRNPTLELGRPDTPACTDKVVKTLASRRFVRVEDMKSLNDFKLMQISWVFDLNFRESFRIVEERSVIDLIAAVLPRHPEMEAAIGAAKDYVHAMARRLAT